MSNIHKQAGTAIVTVDNPDFLGGAVPSASSAEFSKTFEEPGGDGATLVVVHHDKGYERTLDVLIFSTTDKSLFKLGNIVQYNIDGVGDYMYTIMSVSQSKEGGTAEKYSVGIKGFDCADWQAACLADPTALDSTGALINP